MQHTISTLRKLEWKVDVSEKKTHTQGQKEQRGN